MTILKKKNLQKLLIPMAMDDLFDVSLNITYFDSDILFNPFGKNIFTNEIKINDLDILFKKTTQ